MLKYIGCIILFLVLNLIPTNIYAVAHAKATPTPVPVPKNLTIIQNQ